MLSLLFLIKGSYYRRLVTGSATDGCQRILLKAESTFLDMIPKGKYIYKLHEKIIPLPSAQNIHAKGYSTKSEHPLGYCAATRVTSYSLIFGRIAGSIYG